MKAKIKYFARLIWRIWRDRGNWSAYLNGQELDGERES